MMPSLLPKTLFIFGFLTCVSLAGQAQNPNRTGAGHYVKKGELDPARLAALPIDADGAIYYEGVVKVDSTISRQEIHQAVREWFVSNYVSGKDVLQVDDKEAGKILGKGIHRYQFINGINISEVALTFVLSVEAKDGKFRYKMYNFTGGNRNTSMLGGANATSTYAVNYNQCLADYKAGKRTGYNGKIVAGMDYETQRIIEGLEASVKKGKQKSDW